MAEKPAKRAPDPSPPDARELRDAIDAIADGFAYFDAQDRLVAWNPAFMSLNHAIRDLMVVGGEFETMIAEAVRRGQLRDAVGHEEAWIAARLAAHRAGSGDHERHLSDGRWMLARERRVPGGGTVGTWSDISEQKRAQAAVSASHERFRDFAELSADWFWETDGEGRFTSLSAGGEPAIGVETSTLLGLTREAVWSRHVEGFDPASDAVGLAVREHRTFRAEERVWIRPDGERRILVSSGRPVFDGNRAFLGYRGTGRDVTAQRASEETLRKYERMVATSSDAMTFLDRDLCFEVANAAFLRAYRLELDDVIGSPVWRFLPGDAARRQVEEPFRRALAGEPQRFELEIDPFGEGLRWREVVVEPYRSADGEVAGLAITSRDATERITAARQLQALAGRLHAVREEERSEVAREVHDELGQTLTAIGLDLAWLRSKPGVRGELLERLRGTQGLVEEAIRSVRRIASRLRPPSFDDLGLDATIEGAAQEFEARTGVRCQLEVPDGSSTGSRNADLAIVRVLQEALTNVARHAEASAVTIRVEASDAGFELTVSDDGRGAPPGVEHRVDSIGIIGMQERLAAFGGRLRITGSLHGTTVCGFVPVPVLDPPR